MKKRIFSILVTAIMVMLLLPGVVSAEDDGINTFAELQAALEAAQTDTTIELTGNITLTSQLIIDEDITLDGNGNTITRTEANGNASEDAGILVTADGVTIKNLTVSGPNSSTPGWDSGEYGIKVYDADDVVLENVTVKNANAGILVDASKVTIAGKLDVSGNEFGGIEVSKGSGAGLANSTLNIADGAVIVNDTPEVPAIWVEAGEGAVEGGEDIYYAENSASNQTYYVSGLDNVTALFEDAVAVGEDGEVYGSLEAAIADADDGDTITLVDDTDEDVEIEKNITINKNGKKLTGDITVDADAVVVFVNGEEEETVCGDDRHIFGEWRRDGKKMVRECHECGKKKYDELTGTEKVKDQIRATMKFLMTQKYDVVTKTSEGGSTSIDGKATFGYNKDVTINITPDEGYEVESVILDGEDLGAKTSVRIKNIKADHKLEVIFTAVESAVEEAE